MLYDNLPLEMRLYPQWVVWRYEDKEAVKPTKVPYSAINGKHADVTRPDTWATFEQALHALNSSDWYDGIGFVLTEADPYAFIDLDDPYELNAAGELKHPNADEVMQRQIEVYNTFESFAEKSPSGNGLHIIIKGDIPSGRKRSSIEIYSSERFLTMTGNVYRDMPINDHNQMLNSLYAQMGEGKSAAMFYAGLEKAHTTDEEVLNIARNAANSEKFIELYDNGNWGRYYPSQSEGDMALVDIIAFYSENRQQVQKLFLQSKLGQREKSRAQYRLNYMLNKCFDRMSPPVDMEALRNEFELFKANKNKPVVEVTHQDSRAEPEKLSYPKPEDDVYSVPPGLVGQLAQFIYAAAPRPVPEIALAGALGLMAGIVGRAYNVSGTGLNQYILLLAPTGTGKEAIASGMDKLMNAVLKSVPASQDFIGPAEIASSQALIKYMSKGMNSFVSLVGEFGIALQQMAHPNAPPHLVGLRRLMLDLYNKSGEGKVMRPSIYSDKEKNTNTVNAPSFTMLGESTPEKYYEALHEGMISEGLLPRFTTIEYRGHRPPLNEAHTLAQPSFELVDKLSTLCSQALMLNAQNKAVHVKMTEDVTQIFKDFDKHCDLQINSSDKEIRRHLWNRAHVKAMKLAAVIAVGCNPYHPEIDAASATWAIKLIVADVRNLLAKFDSGEIGIDNDETKQLQKVVAACKEYLLCAWKDIESYKTGTVQLHGDRIIPYSFIHKKLAQVAVFRKDRLGNSHAIKRAVKTLVERGDIEELSKQKLSKDYGTTALCYMISNMKILA